VPKMGKWALSFAVLTLGTIGMIVWSGKMYPFSDLTERAPYSSVNFVRSHLLGMSTFHHGANTTDFPLLVRSFVDEKNVEKAVAAWLPGPQTTTSAPAPPPTPRCACFDSGLGGCSGTCRGGDLKPFCSDVVEDGRCDNHIPWSFPTSACLQSCGVCPDVSEDMFQILIAADEENASAFEPLRKALSLSCLYYRGQCTDEERVAAFASLDVDDNATLSIVELHCDDPDAPIATEAPASTPAVGVPAVWLDDDDLPEAKAVAAQWTGAAVLAAQLKAKHSLRPIDRWWEPQQKKELNAIAENRTLLRGTMVLHGVSAWEWSQNADAGKVAFTAAVQQTLNLADAEASVESVTFAKGSQDSSMQGLDLLAMTICYDILLPMKASGVLLSTYTARLMDTGADFAGTFVNFARQGGVDSIEQGSVTSIASNVWAA